MGDIGNSITLDRRRLLAGLVASLAAAPAVARSSASDAASRYPATEALLRAYVAEGKVPGAILAILSPGRHRPAWLRAGTTLFGGTRPVSPDTLWRIYSMTKPITAIAVMQQVAGGRLTLDTPLHDICPEFARMTVLVDPDKGLEARPAERPILVRHLLTHTAGFSYTISGNGPLEREYRRLGIQPMSQTLGQRPGETPAPPLGEYLKRLSTLPLRYEPGTRWHYSIGLDVAGGMLERLTGTPFDRILERQLFEPLGMRDTGFWVSEARRPRLAGSYAWADPRTLAPTDRPTLVDGPDRTEWASPPAMLAGGAGLVSSAADYARFAQMMLNEGEYEGRTLLPRGLARLAMHNLMPEGVMVRNVGGYGAGGRSILFDNPTNPEAYRVGTWGWGGAASTLFHVDPVRGNAVVLMLQSLGAKDGPNEKRLLAALSADKA